MSATIKTVRISRITGEIVSESCKRVERDYCVLNEIAKTLAEVYMKEKKEVS